MEPTYVTNRPHSAVEILPTWFVSAEILKTQVLSRLEKMSPQERLLSPGPNAWSASQVVAHLILVEELLVQDWYTAAKQSPTVKPGWKGSLLIGMVNFAMQTSLRLPTRPFLEPDESGEFRDLSYNSLSERWQAVRERLPGTYSSDASALWIIHPIFGPLASKQMGRFLVAHLHHHLKHWPGTGKR